jgi:selenocysteine lyase/cysteine desulfurase
MENGHNNGKGGFIRVEVVTASLGFLTNFEDVYKLWAFVSKFLNPTFISEGGLPTVEEGTEV